MPIIEKKHVAMELDKAREHAQFLIDNQYVKGKTLDEVVKALQLPPEDKVIDPFTFENINKDAPLRF